MNKIKHKIENNVELKRCNRCKKWLPLSCFHKCKSGWAGLQNRCKACAKQYRKDNSEQIAEKNKQYYQNNREQKLEQSKQYYRNNREQIAEQKKQHYQDSREQAKQYRKDNREQKSEYDKQYRKNNRERIEQYRENNRGQMKQYYKDNCERVKQHRQSPAPYDTYARQIKFCEETRRAPDNPEILQVKCAYCGKWMQPITSQVKNRLSAVNSAASGELRFYCSGHCKQVCPIYRQRKYPKGFKQATSREVVPLLRQLVLKRDNYTCQKCGATTEIAQLHVHHIVSYTQNKMQANDPDNCITLCKECHKEVHLQDGCRYVDLKC